MASTDARPFPIKNTAYRVTFPILDADGDLVTGAASLDSEISKDGGTFTDCTNEATEIATSSGVYYLDLSNTEMNADTVAVIVKTSTSGAKTTVIVMYPVEGGDIDVDVTHIAGAAVSTSTAQLGVNVVNAAGTAWGSGAITAASIATDAITAAKIAADAIGASELAADAVAEIADAVWDEAIAGHVSAGSTGESLGEAGADNSSVIATAVWEEDLTGGYSAGTAGDLLNNVSSGADAATIADAVWDEVMSGHVDAGSAGEFLDFARDGAYVDSSATAAQNLKKVMDGTGYNMSASTIGTATSVTNHVLADLRKIGGGTTDYDLLVAILQGAIKATVAGGTNTTTVVTTNLSSATADLYIGKTMFISSGARRGEGGRLVTDYDGATKAITVDPALTSALSPGDTIVLVG